MESNENYNRQHQDIRVENGIKYGDIIEGVDFEYAKKLTQVNAICLALLGWSPPPPSGLRIGGIVEPSTKFRWNKDDNDDATEISLFGVTLKPLNNIAVKFELGSKDDADVMRMGIGYMF